MAVRNNHAIEKAQSDPGLRTQPEEIRREIDFGSKKMQLILQFSPLSTDTLRQETRAILSRELSRRLQCQERPFS